MSEGSADLLSDPLAAAAHIRVVLVHIQALRARRGDIRPATRSAYMSEGSADLLSDPLAAAAHIRVVLVHILTVPNVPCIRTPTKKTKRTNAQKPKIMSQLICWSLTCCLTLF